VETTPHPTHVPPELAIRIESVVLVVWLVIGAIAAGQRHYFSSSDPNCSRTSTIAVTIIAGPLNYIGVNPKVTCKTPQPSK
jgi:membrane protein YdbS with pleckstrin-like domain